MLLFCNGMEFDEVVQFFVEFLLILFMEVIQRNQLCFNVIGKSCHEVARSKWKTHKNCTKFHYVINGYNFGAAGKQV